MLLVLLPTVLGLDLTHGEEKERGEDIVGERTLGLPAVSKKVFSKELGDGLGIEAIFYRRDIRPRTVAEQKMIKEEVAKVFAKAGAPGQFGTLGDISFTVGEEECGFRLTGTSSKDGAKKLFEVRTSVFDRASSDGTPLRDAGEWPDPFGVFPPYEYRVYDVVKTEAAILILMHHLGSMHLITAKLKDKCEIVGDGEEAGLFGVGWKRRKDGFIPVEVGQIIPAGDRVYAFFAGKSGKCMLWEVKGKEAKMVWESDAPPAPNQGAQKP